MGKSNNSVKVVGVGVWGGLGINLLLRSDFGAVGEQAVYTDQGLLVDCATGKMYFFGNDGAEW